MDANFWHKRWQENKIGFHINETNPLLIKYFDRLELAKGQRIFVPLCGKTLDIDWLLDHGMNVVGVELHEAAIIELFSGFKFNPRIESIGKFSHYHAGNLDVYVGDFFDLSTNIIGTVDAVYDRASLVALPQNMRSEYTAHVVTLTNIAKQLLITLEYDQGKISGPPFSVPGVEVAKRYQGTYKINLLESSEIPGGLKERCRASENIWLLVPDQI